MPQGHITGMPWGAYKYCHCLEKSGTKQNALRYYHMPKKPDFSRYTLSPLRHTWNKRNVIWQKWKQKEIRRNSARTTTKTESNKVFTNMICKYEPDYRNVTIWLTHFLKTLLNSWYWLFCQYFQSNLMKVSGWFWTPNNMPAVKKGCTGPIQHSRTLERNKIYVCYPDETHYKWNNSLTGFPIEIIHGCIKDGMHRRPQFGTEIIKQSFCKGHII